MRADPEPHDNLRFHDGKRAMSEYDSCCVDGLSRVHLLISIGRVIREQTEGD